jgi:integrase
MPKLTAHPGVTMVKVQSSAGERWRARWTDPDMQKAKWLTLATAMTKAQREKWAKNQSKTLQMRKMALASGAAPVRHGELTLSAAVDLYFKVNDSRLRDGTVTAYRTGVDALIHFAKGRLLTGRLLQDFADSRLQARKLAQTSDDQGRAFVQTDKLRSLHSVNRELRTTRTVLEWLRVRGHVALTRDDIADALKRHKAKPTEAKPLFTPRLRELLAFCDKYEPQMKPFVVFLLLTGMRVGEATGVRFEQIDLAQSRISLTADDTKTGHGRTVGINPPSPALHRLIESLPQEDGRVFVWTEGQLNDFKKRSWRKLGWRWTPQQLRQTCASYSCSWPALGPFLSAKRLGHSTDVADRLYARAVVGIPATCRDLETAMGIADLI